MKNIFTKVVALAVVASASLAMITVAPTVSAAKNDYNLKSGLDAAKTDDQAGDLFGDTGIFTTIVNVALFLIGTLSVIMLIYGGIQYTLSSGDSGKVNNAKNTILYAIVGLIVAILSYAIVNFVLSSLKGE